MGKKWPFVLLGLVVVLAGAFFGYRYYRSRQPDWSLQALIAACQQRDMAKARLYVDTNAVASTAVDELAGLMVPGGGKDNTEGVGQVLGALGAGLARMVKPNVSREFDKSVEQAVVSGKLASLRLGDGPPPARAETGGANVFLGPQTRQAGQAHVAVTYLPPDGSPGILLDVVLAEAGDHWQVIAIGNLKGVLGNAAFSALP